MTGDSDRDVSARLAELEATVRGLTQELVSAEARIRQLEAALDGRASDARAAKNTPAETVPRPEATPEEAADEAGHDRDDIIVA